MSISHEFADSSLNRILFLSLLASERWLRHLDLENQPSLKAWMEHLYAYLSLANADPAFEDWLASGPSFLVDIHQGHALDDELIAVCEAASVPPRDMREVMFTTTDLVYGHLFAGIQWDWVDGSVTRLAALLGSYGLGFPSDSFVPGSDRSEDGGHGRPVPAPTVAAIRRRCQLEWT